MASMEAITKDPVQLYDEEEFLHRARIAATIEEEMGFRKCLRIFLKGTMYSTIATFACVLEGYSLVIIAGFFVNNQFRLAYGECTEPGVAATCTIAPGWQTALVDGAMAGQVIGIILSGWATDQYGYKRTFMGALIVNAGFIFVQFFSNGSLPIYMVGIILCGIPWGVFQVIAATYASDICPTNIRGYFLSLVNLSWIFGQFIASIVLYAIFNINSPFAYKLAIAVQWIFLPLIIIAGYFAPESPWWLIRHGRNEEALAAIGKISRNDPDSGYTIEGQTILMIATNNSEKASSGITQGDKVGYRQAFNKSNIRRTEIACALWAIQNLCGPALLQFSAEFLVTAGVSEETSFLIQIAQYVVGIVGTMVSWTVMRYAGRRTTELRGLMILLGFLILIGVIALCPLDFQTQGYAVSGLLLAFNFIYNASVGPVTYALVSEMPSSRTKAKTVALARACYLAASLFNGGVTPQMLAPEAWNWGAKAALFWAGLTVICIVYVYFRVPETKERTNMVMDEMFATGIKARDFQKWVHPSTEGLRRRSRESQISSKLGKEDSRDGGISPTTIPEQAATPGQLPMMGLSGMPSPMYHIPGEPQSQDMTATILNMAMAASLPRM